MRRVTGLVGTVVVLAAAWLSFAAPASAQTQLQAVVTVSGTEPMAIHFNCNEPATTEPGTVTFSRTGPTEGPLTVTYHISGGPTSLNSDPQAGEYHQASFNPGEATVTVHDIDPVVSDTTTDAEVVLVDGEAYAVGDPDHGTIDLQTDRDECETTTTTTTTIVATQDTLARTGVRPTTAPLAFTGIVMLALGAALVAGAARRRTAG